MIEELVVRNLSEFTVKELVVYSSDVTNYCLCLAKFSFSYRIFELN